MNERQNFNLGGKGGSSGSFIGIILLILGFVLLFFLAKGIFTILSFVAPVLLVLALIIDYTVFLDFGKFIIKLFKNNLLIGILAVLLTVIGFPIVAGYLFFKSLLKRKIGKMMDQHQQGPKELYSDYEVVEEEVEDFLELPEIEKPSKDKEDNEYENLF